jgi:hypothetical protein
MDSNIAPDVDMGAIMNKFINHEDSKTHSRHISTADCKNVGLNIIDMEENQEVQDLILSIHHCYMILLEKTNLVKVVENHEGNGMLVQAPAIVPQST